MRSADPSPGTSRAVLISGGSAGLGSAIARQLARRRLVSRIALLARRSDRLEDLASELRSLDSRIEVLPISADLADPDVPARVVAQAVEQFGGLDLLVNNAGLGLPTLFADANPDLLKRQIAVNFTAPLLLSRAALPSLIARKGMIINIGSAITCVANSALGAYGATKVGLAYWNDALRREVGSLGVRVCLVEPGPIGTEFSQAFTALAQPGHRAHPVVETPSGWMTADVDDVAYRIVRLIDRPRRRLSVRRRMVWSFRALGSLFRLWPALGDLVVTRVFHVYHSVSQMETVEFGGETDTEPSRGSKGQATSTLQRHRRR
jgi:short-subunit dehydrogenase